MIIITWNANDANRWDKLWNDSTVQTLWWDVICLQEAGNPVAGWSQVEGKPWGAHTSASFLIRKYVYVTPFGLPVFITHCEWVNRQKNHLVMITRALPGWASNLSGDMGERPCLGIKARLHFREPNKHQIDVLIGCVHIIATSSKAPAETNAMIQYVDMMANVTQCQGWVLFGDFNAAPTDTAHATNRHVVAFNGWTQVNQKNYPIDYLVASNQNVVAAMYSQWEPGTAMSDHRLMSFNQLVGAAVEIL